MRFENDADSLRSTESQPCGQLGYSANIPRNYSELVGLSAFPVRSLQSQWQGKFPAV